MEFIIFIIFSALTIIPMWKLLDKANYHPLWALACLIPFGLIVLLWLIAGRLAPSDGKRD